MEALYRALLLLTLRHTAMLPALSAYWVFGKREIGTILKRLTDAGSIRQHTTRTGTAVNGKTWVQPTVSTCKEFGFPASRATAPTPEAMVSHLAALWVALGDRKRPAHKLEPSEVLELLDVEMPVNVTFVLEKETLWRLLVTQRDVTDAVLATRKIHDEWSAEPKLRDAVAGGHLGVCLCVETALKAERVTEALASKIGVDRPVASLLKTRVMTTPTLDTLGEMLTNFSRAML